MPKDLLKLNTPEQFSEAIDLAIDEACPKDVGEQRPRHIQSGPVISIAEVVSANPELAKKLLGDAGWVQSRYWSWTWLFDSRMESGAPELSGRRLRARCMVLDELMDAGLVLSPEKTNRLLMTAARMETSTETIAWLIDKEVLTAESVHGILSKYMGNAALIKAVAPASEQSDALFGRMLELGIAGVGPLSVFSSTDLALAGAWDRAAELIKRGMPLESTRCGGLVGPGLEPLEAYCHALCLEHHYHNAGNLPTPQACLEGLERLAAWGARVPGPPGSDEAFAYLTGMGCHHQQFCSMEALEAMGAKLVELGADPNGGGSFARQLTYNYYLAREWSSAADFGKQMDWARSLGFDPVGHGPTMLAMSGRLRSEMDFEDYLQRMSDLGVLASSLAASDLSPFQSCLADQRFGHARKLRERGAPIDYTDWEGAGALHILAQFSAKDALAFTSEALADAKIKAAVDRAGKSGETALHIACFNLNAKAVDLLLKAGAGPNAKDAKGWTPIRHLLRKFGAKAIKKCEPILRALIEAGADPSIPDLAGRTPAQAAAAKAPLGALAELFGARPEDLVGEASAAKSARKGLGGRGAAAQSLSEQVQIKSVVVKDQAVAPARKSRSL